MAFVWPLTSHPFCFTCRRALALCHDQSSHFGGRGRQPLAVDRLPWRRTDRGGRRNNGGRRVIEGRWAAVPTRPKPRTADHGKSTGAKKRTSATLSPKQLECPNVTSSPVWSPWGSIVTPRKSQTALKTGLFGTKAGSKMGEQHKFPTDSKHSSKVPGNDPKSLALQSPMIHNHSWKNVVLTPF